jgi:hypothetical protein
MPNNELGDFQTPDSLAARVVSLVSGLASMPTTIVEPTCGEGSFIDAALQAFPSAIIHGLEVQEQYIRTLERRFQLCPRFILHKENYFDFDWDGLIANMAKPVWVIGNPPWVTNTQQMKLKSWNLPKKSPQAHLRGYEAQTGKSNFDISESMLRDWFRWCSACGGTLAVICKTSVARKVLQWWWKQNEPAPRSRMHLIDAQAEFGATVSACVLVSSFAEIATKTCELFESLEAQNPQSTFGLIAGCLISDERTYRKGRELLGKARPQWRSGIKHDLGTVLELTEEGGELRNRLGETVNLEPVHLYPLIKGSDLWKLGQHRRRAMIVPQTRIGEDTSPIKARAPRTWEYLKRHKSKFLARKSRIYANRDSFSIFGVGEYTFLPWKVAIGALYKRLEFTLVGPIDGKPVVFDDTVYFLGFTTEQEARAALSKLQNRDVQDFLRSMIFWDDMRPIKTEILNRVNLSSIPALQAA